MAKVALVAAMLLITGQVVWTLGAVALEVLVRWVIRRRDPLRREMARLTREATPGPRNEHPRPFPTVVAAGDALAFVAPVPELRNPIGSYADPAMWLDDGVVQACVALNGCEVDPVGLRAAPDPDYGLCLADVDDVAEGIGGEWTVTVRAPLWEATWRREARARWACVAHGPGYA